MCLIKYHVLMFCLIILDCYALNCRTKSGPKEAELKKIYTKCLKMQEGKNSSNSRDYTGDQDWKETRGHNQRYDWVRDQMGSNNDRMRSNSEGTGRRNYETSGRDDGTGSREAKTSNRGNTMGNRDNRMEGRDSLGRDDFSSGRNDFQSENYGSDMSRQYNGYQSSTLPSRRYKRERDRRTENSGQRSQFNPNSTKKSPGCGDINHDDKNSGESISTKYEDNRACALHCFLENLEMTGENGMPDRYLVTHVLTKEVVNEDLKDFLQESIEECFQILDNDDTEDKCEFSKNLLMCLSEKGRANCDDWKDELQF